MGKGENKVFCDVIPSEKWRNENTLEEQAVVGTYPPLPKSLERISEASLNLL